MVLVQRAVPPVHQVVELQVAEGCPMQKILELTAQRSMVGLLVQMVHLSAQAGDVFQSVMADASRTAQRIASLAARVEKITTEDLPRVEAFFKDTPVTQLFENGRSFWHAKATEEAQVFRAETKPTCMVALYEAALPPPNLAVMDPYMDNGESALKKYTNPEFFVMEWIQEMERQREEARKARREKKKTKRGTRPTGAAVVRKPVKRVKKYYYDPLTGEKTLITTGDEQDASSAAPETQQARTFATSSSAAVDGPPPPPMPSRGPAVPAAPASAAPPPPPMAAPAPPGREKSGKHHHHHKQSSAAQSTTSAAAPPPPPPMPESSGAPAPPPPPPPPMPGMSHAQQHTPGADVSDAPPAPGSMAAQLQAARAAGLRPVQQQAPKVEARSDLMNMIRSGIQLKKASDRVLDTVPKPAAGKPSGGGGSLSVAEILARRIAIADSDDEEEEDDDAWDD